MLPNTENNATNETKQEDREEDVPTEPPKPTFIDKLKTIRWTFKFKNNLSNYVTVEPLVCFYMLQIFLMLLIEPYYFHKACVSLDQEVYFCDVISGTKYNYYQKCAEFDDEYPTIYCKQASIDNETISCSGVIDRYKESNKTRVLEKPEDYRFCNVAVKTFDKIFFGVGDSIGIFALMVNFPVVMVISIWSDKNSKRKICFLLPLLGQLLICIITLYDFLSSSLSFEYINYATKFIDSLSGGMSLFLFGCFSYMSDDKIRHNLICRFGIIALIITIIRFTPLSDLLYKFYYDDDNAYLYLLSMTLTFNIICLLYVKVILNEVKRDPTTEKLHVDSESLRSSKSRKYTKMRKLAKALNLDVVWDYLLIIFKKRIEPGRFIIMLFLIIILVQKLSPCDNDIGYVLSIDDISINVTDIDGAIFVLIYIMMLLFKISDVIVAILMIGLPTVARLFFVLGQIKGEINYQLEYSRYENDFYSPLKRIASCSLLLTLVDKNETRIFLFVQVIAYLPKLVFRLLSAEEGWDLFDELDIDEWRDEFSFLLVFTVLILCCLGVLYKLVEKYEHCRRAQMHTGEISDRPSDFITTEDNFVIVNEDPLDDNESSQFA